LKWKDECRVLQEKAKKEKKAKAMALKQQTETSAEAEETARHVIARWAGC
jgi:hypothetical protein